MNETEIAQQIATGEAKSPTSLGSFTLWAIRVTGTGAARREALNETAYRSPGTWLTDATLARLSGVPVIWEHPEGRSTLDSNEFSQRVIGSIQYAYIGNERGFKNDQDPDTMGPDVWCVARIFDNAANEEMAKEQLSTSPAVVFKPNDGNTTLPLADGSHMLVEGDPSLIDHLAVCQLGIWDKGGPASGIRDDNYPVEKDV